MEQGLLIGVGVIAIILLVFFGGTAIITTFTGDVSQKASDLLIKTNERCDACLEQFSPEVRCTHESDTRVCVVLKRYECALNCTVELT